jgi:hypothetical protein
LDESRGVGLKSYLFEVEVQRHSAADLEFRTELERRALHAEEKEKHGIHPHVHLVVKAEHEYDGSRRTAMLTAR